MKKITVFIIMAFVFVFTVSGTLVADDGSGRGITKSYSDKELRELWELFERFSEEKLQKEIKDVSTILDTIEGLKDDEDDEWKNLIMDVYMRAWKLYQEKPGMPETSFLVARSYYYNNRSDKAKSSLKKVFHNNSDFIGAHILAVAIKLLDAEFDANDDGVNYFLIEKTRKDYEKILGMNGVTKEDESKIFYRIGTVYANRAFNKKKARVYWQKAYEAAPDSYWGKRGKKLLEKGN
jgi:tetratricopeptide (TPR) repeat protein